MRDVLLGLLLGALLVGLGQLAPPLHLLTHEFTQGFAVLAGLGVLFLAHRRAGLRGPLATALALGLGVVLVALPVDAQVHGCRTESAHLFFWLTWAPVGLLAAVSGQAARRRGWGVGKLAGAVALFVLLLLVHDGGQLLLGRRVTDPLLGAPLFVDQRADMAMDTVQVLQRAWLLLVGLAMAARRGRALLLVVTLLAGSRIGLGWGAGRLRAALDATRHTAHFDIHYGSGDTTALYLDKIEREAEWQWESLAGDLQVRDGTRVALWVYEDRDQLVDLTGIGAAHAWLYRVDLPWRYAVRGTLRHELVHALHAEARPSLLIAPNRGFVEGTAVAWEEGLVWDAAAHAQAAALLANGDLPSAVDFMSLAGFYKVDERTAYEAAGSFIGWLVLRDGADKLWQLQRSLDYQATYGEDLSALDADWRAFLATVPVDLSDRARARQGFDRRTHRAYTDRRCPKLGRRGWRGPEWADALLSRQDYARAAQAFAGLWERRGAPSDAAQAGRAWLAAAAVERAQGVVEQALSGDELGEDERAELLQVRLAVAVARGEPVGAWVAALVDIGGTDEQAMVAVARLAGRAELREALVDLLCWGGADPAVRLHTLAPQDADATLLFERYGLVLPAGGWPLGSTSAERADLARALSLARGGAAACDALAEPLASAGVALVRDRELDAAQAVADVLASPCTRPFTSLSARRLAARVAWERGWAGER